MSNDIIKVDFSAKQVIESAAFTPEQVYNAIAVLQGFMNDDLKQKELDINNALQIMDHDLEDMTDEELDGCDGIAILKRRRTLRVQRRSIKELQGLQEKTKNNITIGNMTDLAKKTEQHEEKCSKGSADAFFSNSLARKALSNKTLLKNSRIKV